MRAHRPGGQGASPSRWSLLTERLWGDGSPQWRGPMGWGDRESRPAGRCITIPARVRAQPGHRGTSSSQVHPCRTLPSSSRLLNSAMPTQGKKKVDPCCPWTAKETIKGDNVGVAHSAQGSQRPGAGSHPWTMTGVFSLTRSLIHSQTHPLFLLMLPLLPRPRPLPFPSPALVVCILQCLWPHPRGRRSPHQHQLPYGRGHRGEPSMHHCLRNPLGCSPLPPLPLCLRHPGPSAGPRQGLPQRRGLPCRKVHF